MRRKRFIRPVIILFTLILLSPAGQSLADSAYKGEPTK